MVKRWRPPQRLKQPIRSVVARTGYEFVAISRPETRFLTDLLGVHRVSLLVDVGANQGQYAQHMRTLGYQGKILSFEPGGEAHRLLLRNSSNDAPWEVRRLALGASSAQGWLNVSHDSVSSSLLEVAAPHVRVAPMSSASYTEQVQVSTLDQELPNMEKERIWLKLDTQGSEDDILRGGYRLLPYVQVLQTEINLVDCYAGQADYRTIFDMAHSAGLLLVRVEPGTQDQETGELLQFDAIFGRASGEIL